MLFNCSIFVPDSSSIIREEGNGGSKHIGTREHQNSSGTKLINFREFFLLLYINANRYNNTKKKHKKKQKTKNKKKTKKAIKNSIKNI